MQSSQQEVKNLALHFLKENNIPYKSLEKPVAIKENDEGNNFGYDFWTIPFEYKIPENEMAFILIKDDSRSIICLLAKDGSHYVNWSSPDWGSENKVRETLEKYYI